jgi:hypothetical protein
MMSEKLDVSFPRHPISARATIEPLPPDSYDASIELQKALRVCRAAVVLVVASELGVEGLLLLVHRCMSVLLAPFSDRREGDPLSLSRSRREKFLDSKEASFLQAIQAKSDSLSRSRVQRARNFSTQISNDSDGLGD